MIAASHDIETMITLILCFVFDYFILSIANLESSSMKSRTTRSRTFFTRTIGKVKSRISSINNTVSLSQSPDPLLPNHAPRKGSPLPSAVPTIARRPKSPPLLEGAQDASTQPISSTPSSMATPSITTSSFIVYDNASYPKYLATAYINVDVCCILQNPQARNALSGTSKRVRTTDNHIHSLVLTTPTLSGPCALLSHYGTPSHGRLTPASGEHWVTVLHIGIKDTSLASKLSTSMKKSAGRLSRHRFTNIALIDKWLDVLQKDSDDDRRKASGLSVMGEHDTVAVKGFLKFKHGLMPRNVDCQLAWECTVDMKEDGGGEESSRVVSDESMRRLAMDNDDEDEDEDEERVREARLLGAPWL